MSKSDETRRRHRRRQRILGAVAALSVGAGVAAAGGSADAASFIDIYLHPIRKLSGGLCEARVGVDIQMPYADALDVIAHPGDEATMKLYGDDPWFDNALINLPVDSPTWPQAWAGGYSVEFTRVFGCDVLNEDWNDPEDEIYARVRFLDIRTGQTHYANSGNWVDSYPS
jgi:hypothetical protein